MLRSVVSRRGGPSGRALLVVSVAAALAGCSAYSAERDVTPPSAALTGSVPRALGPLPDRALLAPQRAPACEYKTGSTGEDAAEAQRVKLDYERQCYRHAELLVRGRPTRLQDA